jgi:hypothetical protein
VAERGSHARHDRFAIADAVGAGIVPTTIGSCPACGALHADLLAIRTAIRHAWVPARRRGFLLSVGDGIRLRLPRWRVLLAAVGTSRDAVTRPLALGLTGVGLSGLLLTAIPVGAFGAATGGAAASMTPEVGVTAGQVATMAEDRVAGTADDDPLAGLSAALLAAGGAMFLLRRATTRAIGVR